MTRILPRSLVFVALSGLLGVAAPALAEPAEPARPAAEPATDASAQQEREVLAIAEQLAGETSQAIEQWLTTQAVTEDRLFARFYYPIAKTQPIKWTTAYDVLADRDLVAFEDKALARMPALQYAIVTDLNGYVPAHNTRFSQATTGKLEQDYINSRSKRMLGDPASLVAARSTAHHLVQRSRLESGDVISDLSIPIIVHGKHWGCVRIGYRRSE